MIRRTALALCLAAAPALAQDAPLAPEAAPLPQARPDAPAAEEPIGDPEANAEDAADASAEPSDDRPDLIPPEDAPQEPSDDLPDLIPPENMPAGDPDSPSEADPAPDQPDPPPEDDAPPLRETLTETPEELAACHAELDAMNVTWEVAEPVSDEGNPDCGIANPVTVTEIAPGVLLEPPSPMRCATALAAARWVQDVVIPLGRKLEGRGGVTVVDQGAPYVCRPRADGDLSEHATGSALDVMGFRFAEGEPIPVEPRAGDGTLEEAFQRAVRAGACLDFPTVLGPGSDADHADHLHLDVKARDGGFRICD